MKEYNTSTIAKEFNIHPNTVRFYEEIGFLPKIPRKENGYRLYNQIHYEQLKLIRIGLKSELLQNGLRKQVINIIKVSANGEYDRALELAKEHDEDIVSACDKLILSLKNAKIDCIKMTKQIEKMKKINPPV